MASARSFARFLPAAFAVLAVVSLAGCASSGGSSSTRGGLGCACSAGEGPCGPAAPPLGLPDDPAPCLKYCRVWVPPVYRDVPKIESVCGTPRTTDKTVIETTFKTVKIPGARYGCTTPSCDCDEVAVEVCPGGWKWQQVDGCWRYCECPPKYKWCKKQVHEDGITYCADEPDQYKTVAVRREKRVCDTEYVPATTRTVWVKELYRPGHWEWVAKQDCCAKAPNCDCCRPYTYTISSDCSCSK